MRPGIFYVRIQTNPSDSINLVVDGGELTFRRLSRIGDGVHHGDAEAVARAFKAFVKEWGILGDDGRKPLPISKGSVDRLGIGLIFGLAVETANALGIHQKPRGQVLTDRETGQRARANVSTTSPESATVPVRQQTPAPVKHSPVPVQPSRSIRPSNSLPLAYILWLLTGLTGGHRYYVGRTGSAFFMTITLGGLGLWWIQDLFLVRGLVQYRIASGS